MRTATATVGAACCLLAATLTCASSASAAVTVTYAQTNAGVERSSDHDSQSYHSLSGDTATATLLPGYSSVTTSDFSSAGDSASFSVAFSQARGALYGYAEGDAFVEFSISADVAYSLAGQYANTAGWTSLSSSLYDMTAGNLFFFNVQQSNVSDSFTLGKTEGSHYNWLEGSLTGTLLAGHSYRWIVSAVSEEFLAAESGATASGGATLLIGEPETAAVPEASSLVVWSLLGLATGGGAWWRRRRVST